VVVASKPDHNGADLLPFQEFLALALRTWNGSLDHGSLGL